MHPPAHVRERVELHRRPRLAKCAFGAGGGIRTLTLSRAPAPKAGMSAVPSRPQTPRAYRFRPAVEPAMASWSQYLGVLSRDVHYTSSEACTDRAGGLRGRRLPGFGLVAVDEISIDVGHLPESRLCLAVAGVRRILHLCLSQIRP